MKFIKIHIIIYLKYGKYNNIIKNYINLFYIYIITYTICEIHKYILCVYIYVKFI